jgi:hypothetical protein
MIEQQRLAVLLLDIAITSRLVSLLATMQQETLKDLKFINVENQHLDVCWEKTPHILVYVTLMNPSIQIKFIDLLNIPTKSCSLKLFEYNVFIRYHKIYE